MTIRPATPADAALAARIIAAALAEYRLPFEPEGRDADVASFGGRPEQDDFVAEDASGGAIGVASIDPQGEEGVAWLSKLFVDRGARKQGAGGALLEAAHRAACARGFRACGLRTRLVFLDAIALYERAGYARREDPAATSPGDVVYYRHL